MRHNLVLLSAMCLALASVANASVHKGQVDLELLGGLSMESSTEGSTQDDFLAGQVGADFDGWFASGGISWFRTGNLQLGVTGFYSSMDGSESVFLVPNTDFPETHLNYDVDVDLEIYGVGGRAKWHFNPTGSLVPFVGIQGSWATANVDVSGDSRITISGEIAPDSEARISESDTASGILWGPLLGLRLKLGDTDDLLFEYQYQMWAGSIGDLLDNGHAFSVGLSHRLK